jgi:hypothetical protein
MVALEPFTTLCLWITPVAATAPGAPQWIEAVALEGNVVLRWRPSHESSFYSYEVFLLQDGSPAERLTPDPLRAALWVDTGPPPGRRVYGVRSVSASGVVGPLVASPEVVARP